MGIYQHVHACACVYVYVHAYACMYILQYPPPILKLASLALPPILKSFLRLCYMYSIARNPICEYWDITSSQHTIGLSGHHRPANETNILMAFRWRADSDPIYMGLVARIPVQG